MGCAVGFTLIELLASIFIVGILASLIVATLSRLREAAEVTQCVSNLRTLQQGILLFANENEGKLPFEKPGIPKSVSGYDAINWHRRISPYLGGPEPIAWKNTEPVPSYYLCPGDKSPFAGVISYGMNWNLLNSNIYTIGNNPIILADCTTVELRANADGTFIYLTNEHHNGKVNAVLLDGSIETYEGMPPTCQEVPNIWLPQ